MDTVLKATDTRSSNFELETTDKKEILKKINNRDRRPVFSRPQMRKALNLFGREKDLDEMIKTVLPTVNGKKLALGYGLNPNRH